MATHHDKHGRFCSKDSAAMMVKGGKRYKVVRQYRAMGGKPTRTDEAVASIHFRQSRLRLDQMEDSLVPLSDLLG